MNYAVHFTLLLICWRELSFLAKSWSLYSVCSRVWDAEDTRAPGATRAATEEGLLPPTLLCRRRSWWMTRSQALSTPCQGNKMGNLVLWQKHIFCSNASIFLDILCSVYSNFSTQKIISKVRKCTDIVSFVRIFECTKH